MVHIYHSILRPQGGRNGPGGTVEKVLLYFEAGETFDLGEERRDAEVNALLGSSPMRQIGALVGWLLLVGYGHQECHRSARRFRTLAGP